MVKPRPSLETGNWIATSDARSRYGARSSGFVFDDTMIPSGASRAASKSLSRSRRAKLMSAGPAGNGASSSTFVQISSTARPAASSSAIQSFLERRQANAPIGLEEAFAVISLSDVDLHDRLDRVDHLVIGEGVADDLADRSILHGRAAQRQLVIFLTLLIDAEDADMADVVMAARIDAA